MAISDVFLFVASSDILVYVRTTLYTTSVVLHIQSPCFVLQDIVTVSKQ